MLEYLERSRSVSGSIGTRREVPYVRGIPHSARGPTDNGIVAPDELEAAEDLSAWAVESRYDDHAIPALDRQATMELLAPPEGRA
jgi:hypothetical protein